MVSSRQAQFGFSGMFGRPPRATLALMVATGVLSVLSMASAGAFGTGAVTQLLLFSPAQVLERWRIWTAFTYLFVDVDPFNLLLYEVFGLWVFASALEHHWGTRRFLFYFFGTGAGAAVATTALAIALPSLDVNPLAFRGTYVAGDAIIVGWVLMNWNATAYLIVLPVRAPWLLVPAIAIPLLYMIQGVWQPFVPVLLAMAIGYFMLHKRGASLRRGWLKTRAWWIDRQLKRRAKHLRVVRTPDGERDHEPPRYLH